MYIMRSHDQKGRSPKSVPLRLKGRVVLMLYAIFHACKPKLLWATEARKLFFYISKFFKIFLIFQSQSWTLVMYTISMACSVWPPIIHLNSKAWRKNAYFHVTSRGRSRGAVTLRHAAVVVGILYVNFMDIILSCFELQGFEIDMLFLIAGAFPSSGSVYHIHGNSPFHGPSQTVWPSTIQLNGDGWEDNVFVLFGNQIENAQNSYRKCWFLHISSCLCTIRISTEITWPKGVGYLSLYH